MESGVNGILPFLSLCDVCSADKNDRIPFTFTFHPHNQAVKFWARAIQNLSPGQSFRTCKTQFRTKNLPK